MAPMAAELAVEAGLAGLAAKLAAESGLAGLAGGLAAEATAMVAERAAES